jgi:membrane protease YdiL (CAAX protease family)
VIIVVLLAYAIPAILVARTALGLFGTHPAWKDLGVILGGIAMITIAVWGLRKDGIAFEAIGLSLPGIKEAIILAAVGWAVIVLASYVVLVAANSDSRTLFGKPVLYILQYWIFVGIAEEVLFRGYMLTRLMDAWTARNKVWGRLAAVAVSSLIFATAHIPQRLYQITRGEMTSGAVLTSVVLLSIVGIVFSYLFLRTGNVLLVGLVHGAVIVPLVGVSEDAFLPVVIVAAILIEVSLFLRRKKKWAPKRSNE